MEFITAVEAREKALMITSLTNGLTVLHINGLISLTAIMGFSRIVLCVLPKSLDEIKKTFPDFRIEVLDFKETLYPECIVILMLW